MKTKWATYFRTYEDGKATGWELMTTSATLEGAEAYGKDYCKKHGIPYMAEDIKVKPIRFAF